MVVWKTKWAMGNLSGKVVHMGKLGLCARGIKGPCAWGVPPAQEHTQIRGNQKTGGNSSVGKVGVIVVGRSSCQTRNSWTRINKISQDLTNEKW